MEGALERLGEKDVLVAVPRNNTSRHEMKR